MDFIPGARIRRSWSAAALLIVLMACPQPGLAIGQPHYIETAPMPGGFTLARNGVVANLYVDPKDDWGVIHAVHELQADIQRVTGSKPALPQSPESLRRSPESLQQDIILIGTLGKSRLIDRLIANHAIDVSSIRGRWESTLTQVVDHPLPGIARALVIAGSDPRGTIYGIYDLSAGIGVSPWYWWADVPVPHRDALYAKVGRWLVGPPAVKYRGIFLNDEAPSLTGW